VILVRSTIQKELPERDAQFASGFLEAGEGVPASPAHGTPGRADDLASLDVLTDIIFAKVVVQWDFGSQYQEEFLFVVVEALEGEVEELIIGVLCEDLIEGGLKPFLFLLRRRGLIVLQLVVEIPDLLSDLFEDFFSVFVRGNELVDGPFGMNPAQIVEEEIKLAGIVTTDDDKAFRQAMIEHGTDEGAFGCDADMAMALIDDAQILQMSLPLLIIEEMFVRRLADLSEQGFCKVVGFHVYKGILIDAVVVMAGTQEPEEVDSALAVRAFKPGKQVVAHVGAVAIFSVMRRAPVSSTLINEETVRATERMLSFSSWKRSFSWIRIALS